MAGAGFKTFNTGDVLTASDVNTYLMQQTVMVFANSTARSTALGANVSEGMLSYLTATDSIEYYNGSAWVAAGASGDITAVNAGTGISGGGTSGDVTITNSMATAIDAKGDLIVGTGADTFSRLAVGTTNGHVLQVDSTAATGMKWAAAGGSGLNWTLLNAGGTALTGAQTITVSGISNKDYLMVRVYQASSASASSQFRLRINNDSTAIYYGSGFSLAGDSAYSAGIGSQVGGNGDSGILIGFMASNQNSLASSGTLITGGSTTGFKAFTSTAGVSAGSGNNQVSHIIAGAYEGSSAITSISINSSTGNFDNGTIYVYGA